MFFGVLQMFFVTFQRVLWGAKKNLKVTPKEPLKVVWRTLEKLKNPLWIFKEPSSDTQRTFEGGLKNLRNNGRTLYGSLKNLWRTSRGQILKNSLWIFKEPSSETQRTFGGDLKILWRSIRENKLKNSLWFFKEPSSETIRTI